MKYMREVVIIFGITMLGEFLNSVLPFPVPAGVYGLFLLLILLCSGLVKVEQVSSVGDILLDTMPLMFIPAAVGLMTSVEEARKFLIPLVVISVASTIFVMSVTGLTAQKLVRRRPGGTSSTGTKKGRNAHE